MANSTIMNKTPVLTVEQQLLSWKDMCFRRARFGRLDYLTRLQLDRINATLPEQFLAFDKTGDDVFKEANRLQKKIKAKNLKDRPACHRPNIRVKPQNTGITLVKIRSDFEYLDLNGQLYEAREIWNYGIDPERHGLTQREYKQAMRLIRRLENKYNEELHKDAKTQGLSETLSSILPEVTKSLSDLRLRLGAGLEMANMKFDVRDIIANVISFVTDLVAAIYLPFTQKVIFIGGKLAAFGLHFWATLDRYPDTFCLLRDRIKKGYSTAKDWLHDVTLWFAQLLKNPEEPVVQNPKSGPNEHILWSVMAYFTHTIFGCGDVTINKVRGKMIHETFGTINSVFTFFSKFGEMFKYGVDWVLIKFGFEPIFDKTDVTLLAKIRHSVGWMADWLKKDRNLLTNNDYREIIKTSNTIHPIYKEMLSSVNLSRWNTWFILYNRFSELVTFSTNALESSQHRVEPLGIWLGGEPGTGKSISYTKLSRDLEMLLKQKTIKDPSIYVRNAHEEYWSNYHNQFTTVVDECYQAKSKESNEQTSTMILNAISATHYPLVMAAVEDKGKTSFNSDLVMCISNFVTFPTDIGINFKGAMARRLIFMRMKVNSDAYDVSTRTWKKVYDPNTAHLDYSYSLYTLNEKMAERSICTEKPYEYILTYLAGEMAYRQLQYATILDNKKESSITEVLNQKYSSRELFDYKKKDPLDYLRVLSQQHINTIFENTFLTHFRLINDRYELEHNLKARVTYERDFIPVLDGNPVHTEAFATIKFAESPSAIGILAELDTIVSQFDIELLKPVDEAVHDVNELVDRAEQLLKKEPAFHAYEHIGKLDEVIKEKKVQYEKVRQNFRGFLKEAETKAFKVEHSFQKFGEETRESFAKVKNFFTRKDGIFGESNDESQNADDNTAKTRSANDSMILYEDDDAGIGPIPDVNDKNLDEKPRTQGFTAALKNNRFTNYWFGSKEDHKLFVGIDAIVGSDNDWVMAPESCDKETFETMCRILNEFKHLKPSSLWYFGDNGLKIDWEAIEIEMGKTKGSDSQRMLAYYNYLKDKKGEEKSIIRRSTNFVLSIVHELTKDPILLSSIVVTTLMVVASAIGVSFLLFANHGKTQVANYQDDKNPNRRNPQEIAKLLAKPKAQLGDQQTYEQGLIIGQQYGNILIETKGIGQSVGKALCVRGTSWIFPLHYLAKAFDKKARPIDTNIRMASGGLLHQAVNLTECEITVWNNKLDLQEGEEPYEADMVTLTIPARFAMRGKDLTKYFITDAEVDNRCLSRVLCIYPAKPGETNDIVFERVDKGQFLFKNQYSNYNKTFSASDDNLEYITTHAIAYERMGNPGDCMSLYGLDNPRSQHKFIGAHIAGSKNKSYCLLITQSHIERFVPKQPSFGKILDYGGTNEEIKCASGPIDADMKLYIPENSMIHGVLDMKYNNHLNRKTDLVRTPMFPEIESARAPAVLRKVNGVDPFLKAIARDNFIQERPMAKDPRHNICYVAAKDLMEARMKALPYTFARGKLSLSDCINRPVDSENLLGSRQSTSAGFAMRINGGGAVGKTAYITSTKPKTENPTYAYEPTERLKTLWNVMETTYRNGETLSFPYNPSLKDELRDVIKVRDLKTRVFKAGCYGLLLTTRCYNGAFLDAYRNSPELMRHCIGVNMCGGFGTYLDDVLSCGRRWAYDIKNNDNTFSRDLIWLYETMKMDFMEKIDDIEEQNSHIPIDRKERLYGRLTVRENALGPMSIYGRVLVQKDGTVPSGDPETSEKNSFGNKIQHDTVILSLIYDNDRELYNQLSVDFKKYDRLFPSFHLGDDMIGSSPNSAKYISFDAVQERIRLFFGRDITLPDKDRNEAGKIEQVTEFRRDNTEFLSRTPKDFFSNTVWCLRRSTIEAIPFWRIKGFTPDPEMCQELCDAALREWFFYGKEEFDRRKAIYDRDLFRLQYGATTLTWNKMIDDWSKGVGGAPQLGPWGREILPNLTEYPGIPKTQLNGGIKFSLNGKTAETGLNAMFSRKSLAQNPQCLRYKEDNTTAIFTVKQLVTTVSKNENQDIEIAPGKRNDLESGEIKTVHVISTVTEDTGILDNPLSVKGFEPNVNPYPPGEIDKALCREYPIATFTFDPVHAYDDLMYQQGFPVPLLEQPYIAQKLSGHKYYRATVVLRIKFNQTKFEYGSFIMNAVSAYAGNYPYASSQSMSMCDPRIVSVGTNTETVIRFPFFTPYNFMTVSSLVNWFTLTVRCLHPLASVNGETPNPLTVAVYAHFEDVETMGYDPQVDVAAAFAKLGKAKKGSAKTQSARPKKVKGKTSIDEGREKSETGLMSGIAEATQQIAPIIGMIDPEIMPIAMAVGNIAGTLAPFFKSLGWNKPNDVRGSLFTGTNGWRGLTHGMGLDSSIKLSLNPEFTIATTGGLCGDNDPNPTILSIMQRPALCMRGYFNNTSTSLLIDFVVSPTLPIDRVFTGVPGAGYENILLSPLGYYTSMFEFFRGSLKVMINFVGSSLMVTSVRVVLNYGTAYDVSTRKGDVINGVYDITGDTCIKFEIPYQGIGFWSPTKDIFSSEGHDCYPRLQVYSETPIKSPDYTVDPSFYYDIWMAAGDDYEVYHYVGPQNYVQATGIRAPAASIPKCQSKPTGNGRFSLVDVGALLRPSLELANSIEVAEEDRTRLNSIKDTLNGVRPELDWLLGEYEVKAEIVWRRMNAALEELDDLNEKYKPRTQMDVCAEFSTKFDKLIGGKSFVEAGVVTGERIDRLQTLLHRYTKFNLVEATTVDPTLIFSENTVNPVLVQLVYPFAVWRGGLRFRYNSTATMRLVPPVNTVSDAYAPGCQWFGNDSMSMGVEVPWYEIKRFRTYSASSGNQLFVGANGILLWSAGDDFSVGYFRGIPWYNRAYTAVSSEERTFRSTNTNLAGSVGFQGKVRNVKELDFGTTFFSG